MQLEAFGIFALFGILLFFFTEWSKIKMFGILGSLVILIMSLWIMAEGIYIPSGQVNSLALDGTIPELTGTFNQTQLAINVSNSSCCEKNITSVFALRGSEGSRSENIALSMNGTATTKTTYQKLTASYIPFEIVLGLFMLLGSIYTFFHYAGMITNRF